MVKKNINFKGFGFKIKLIKKEGVKTNELSVLLECKVNGHSKFYELTKGNCCLYKRYGKIGVDGTNTLSYYNTNKERDNAFNSLVQEKIKKGYVKKTSTYKIKDSETQRYKKVTQTI